MRAGHGRGRLHSCRACSLQKGGEPFYKPLGEARIDEITVDDQQLAARLEDTQPLCKTSGRIDKGPDKMARDDHVVAVIGLKRVLRIAEMKTDGTAAGCGLGAGAFQHGFGPVDAGYAIAEVIHQVGDHAGSARKVESLAAIATAEMPFNERMPGGAFLLGEDLVAGRLVECCSARGPIGLDFIPQGEIGALRRAVALHASFPDFSFERF